MKARVLAAVVTLIAAGSTALLWQRHRAGAESAKAEAAALDPKMQPIETAPAGNAGPAEKSPLKPSALVPMVGAQLIKEPLSSEHSNTSKDIAPRRLLKDPETRALMQKQQQQSVARAADQIVSKGFADQLNLSPEQVARLKELLRERGAVQGDFNTAMLFDGLDDTALAERGRETKQKLDQVNAALRDLLGPESFDALREREQSMEERNRIRHFRQELSANGGTLTPEQENALVAAMGSERQAFPFRVDFRDPSTFDYEHIRDFFSEGNLQAYYEDMQQLNARIAERASLFLDSAQVQQLQAILSEHLEKGRLTVKMTTELFNQRRPN